MPRDTINVLFEGHRVFPHSITVLTKLLQTRNKPSGIHGAERLKEPGAQVVVGDDLRKAQNILVA
jgi:hypothetical protein